MGEGWLQDPMVFVGLGRGMPGGEQRWLELLRSGWSTTAQDGLRRRLCLRSLFLFESFQQLNDRPNRSQNPARTTALP